jgi:prepilin-type N-terminal cleavage/methylation domain-containing protein/prepilin-type processing-associated H-X9-DG protein
VGTSGFVPNKASAPNEANGGLDDLRQACPPRRPPVPNEANRAERSQHPPRRTKPMAVWAIWDDAERRGRHSHAGAWERAALCRTKPAPSNPGPRDAEGNRKAALGRRGFTLVELLVVVAIIGILVGLLLPAVNASRESARRARCLVNLSQLTLALQNYQNTHDVYPPGVANPTGPVQNLPSGYHHGWLVQILPYLDRGDFDGMIDDTAGIYAPTNLPARRAVLASLICPSDVGPLHRADGVADNNYAGCHHDFEAPINTNQNGVLYLNSHVRYDDIPDGSAHTIIVGEKRRFGLDLGWASGTRATLRNPWNRLNAVDDAYSSALLIKLEKEGPNAAPPANPKPDDPLWVGGFGSCHPGGAGFAFCDGSARFLREGIAPQVLRFLANRRDGESIDPDS